MNPQAFAYIAAGLGAGLTIIGGAAGIGRLAAAAMEGIARQPSAAGDIRGAMIPGRQPHRRCHLLLADRLHPARGHDIGPPCSRRMRLPPTLSGACPALLRM